MPFPLSIHAQEKQRARTGLVVLATTFLAAVALLAFLNEYSEPALQIDALELKDGFTVAQIGQYGMRADRQARNFEQGDEPYEEGIGGDGLRLRAALGFMCCVSFVDVTLPSHIFQMLSAAPTKLLPCASRVPMLTPPLLNWSRTRARVPSSLPTRKTKSSSSSVRRRACQRVVSFYSHILRLSYCRLLHFVLPSHHFTRFACVGKDQVTRAVQYNAHARKLRLQAR